MKHEDAVAFLQSRLDGGYYNGIPAGLTEDGEAVRALLEAYRAAREEVCRKCLNIPCGKGCKWRGPEPGKEQL